MKTPMTAALGWMLATTALCAAPAPDSPRLSRAKDAIADEQWVRAVAELQAAVNDRKEPNRDEAMYWLAESEHELGDQALAIQTIARIEQEFPASRWVRPARSLRVEIAQRLRRDDLLWVMAAPMPPAAAPLAPTPAAVGAPPSLLPSPAPRAVRVMTPPPSAPPAVVPTPFPPPTVPAPATERFTARYWTTAPDAPDTEVRIEALGGLMDEHAARVIPLLKEIALDQKQPDEARRAVFVLAQSAQPEARETIIEIAKTGAGPARETAIRELGQFKGPAISKELMQVYAAADSPTLKRQVVVSLGDHADTPALLKIATTEPNQFVRNTAILTLGRAAARTELRTLYVRSDITARPVVLSALFNAKDDEGLIEIARSEKDATLHQLVIQRLRMLATPKAVEFLNEQ